METTEACKLQSALSQLEISVVALVLGPKTAVSVVFAVKASDQQQHQQPLSGQPLGHLHWPLFLPLCSPLVRTLYNSRSV
jgi:hypothetical protein